MMSVSTLTETSGTAPVALPATPGRVSRAQLTSKPRRTLSLSLQHPGRQIVMRVLEQIGDGSLTIVENGTRIQARNRDSLSSAQERDAFTAEIRVLSPEFYERLFTAGTMGAAEAYMDGLWDSPDLTRVLRILLRNEMALRGIRSPLQALVGLAARFFHGLNRNTRHGSRRNIHQHYDLGNDFFETFLDPTMMYSSGLFESPGDSLEQASVNKLERICQELRLSSADHVVEIGTGWGGFAIHAARNYGCRVTTTTISEEQHRYARRRIQSAGLSDRIEVLQKDYRDLTGSYDKLVSIEMVEAVGERFLPTYFRQCANLLKPGGAMLLQAITMPEQRSRQYSRSVDFIRKHIFPGGYLPSLTQMQTAATSTSRLRLLNVTDFGLHYAETLRRWREQFHQNADTIRAYGFDQTFLRKWHYYFCYCEAAFEERATSVVHALWGQTDCALGTLSRA
ncbi:MAG: class I SAM-dependent methyltransferase [Planctomycetaceae bacterium]|nr:class I SAM-dependent methyltransferase [Planctomycetaceae bacterium]